MMTCEETRLHISPLIDGELSGDDAAAVLAHLAGCDACSWFRQDLDRVRRAAASLGPIAPPDHVWLHVAGQTRLEYPAAVAPRRPAAQRGAIAQWLGIAAALIVVTIGAYVVGSTTSSAPQGSNPATTASVETVADELNLAMQHYERAITELDALAQSGSNALDPSMAAMLSQNMKTINAAISESRSALVHNPGNGPARDSLFEALRRKVVVLQATVNLMNEMRKGNQVGAIEAAAAFGKKS
ncbi:MAG TPA: zf-HC2 domain-containing protein [Vicinamibacterales bacterium]|nr:zf-HC2 domain-containing protein [Vicinamibacterales bacterium]